MLHCPALAMANSFGYLRPHLFFCWWFFNNRVYLTLEEDPLLDGLINIVWAEVLWKCVLIPLKHKSFGSNPLSPLGRFQGVGGFLFFFLQNRLTWLYAGGWGESKIFLLSFVESWFSVLIPGFVIYFSSFSSQDRRYCWEEEVDLRTFCGCCEPFVNQRNVLNNKETKLILNKIEILNKIKIFKQFLIKKRC